MKSHKHLLMDFYLALLAIPYTDPFRVLNSGLYAHTRDALAAQLDCDSETVQNIFERMTAEDQPVAKPKYCVNCNDREARLGNLCYRCTGR